MSNKTPQSGNNITLTKKPSKVSQMKPTLSMLRNFDRDECFTGAPVILRSIRSPTPVSSAHAEPLTKRNSIECESPQQAPTYEFDKYYNNADAFLDTQNVTISSPLPPGKKKPLDLLGILKRPNPKDSQAPPANSFLMTPVDSSLMARRKLCSTAASPALNNVPGLSIIFSNGDEYKKKALETLCSHGGFKEILVRCHQRLTSPNEEIDSASVVH